MLGAPKKGHRKARMALVPSLFGKHALDYVLIPLPRCRSSACLIQDQLSTRQVQGGVCCV
jgi:hypothetical protein